MNTQRKTFVWLLLFAALLCLPTALSADSFNQCFYVSPQGKDTNAGNLTTPVASIEKAQELVRSFRRAHPETAVTVYLRDGNYYRSDRLTFTAEDGGTAAAPVIYAAYPGEHPVLLGSIPLQLSWKPYKKGIYQAEVPAGLIFESLYVNDAEQVMARYPNYDAAARIFHGTAADCISPERVKRWKHPADGYLHVMHAGQWGDFHYRFTGKDKKGNLTMEGGWQNNRPENGLHKELRFVENIFEELDTAKEWYLDREKHILYYMPESGVDPTTARVEAASIENFITFKGSEGAPVRYLSLEGISFERSVRTFMKTKEPLLRSDWCIYRGGAILMEGTEHCAVRDCNFKWIGSHAIFVSGYNDGVRIAGNLMEEIGAGGINFVGETSAVRNPLFVPYGPVTPDSELDQTVGPRNNLYPRNCIAEDNLISYIGRVEKQVAGVQISVAMNITVRHNSIYQCPRAGLNVGEGAFGGHLFEYNDVFETVLETSDHGSFNSWGRDRFWCVGNAATEKRVAQHPEAIFYDMLRPNVLRNNRMRCDHGWDIDLDDGSSYYEIYNNLCLKGGIKLREGYYRRVENNICLNNALHPHVWLSNCSDIVRGNIFGSSLKPIQIKQWGTEVDYNWYCDAASLSTSQQNGVEQHSAAGDPMFVNAAAGDFTVRPESEVYRMGWKNIPMDAFGVVSERLRKIAKQPEIPAMEQGGGMTGSMMRDFFDGQIKDLETDGEISATGMSSKRGVLIVKKPTEGWLSKIGAMANDVILKVNGTEINNTAQFMKIVNEATDASPLRSLTIWRNQQFVELQIK